MIELIKKEKRGRSIRAQTSMWIRFRKDEDLVELVFNSLMTNIYNLNNLDEIVLEIINSMKYQIENPVLLNSRFIFEELLYMNINTHQLNLRRGSSCLLLPEMPHKKLIVQYSDGQFQFKVPFIMYADFESILVLIQSMRNDPMISSSRGVNNHVPSGWCIRSEFAYDGKIENPLKLLEERIALRSFVIM